jgi:putative endonuclease
VYYVYVLQSLADHKLYVGQTHDLKRRIEKHNRGSVPSTSNRRPLRLIYYEASMNKDDAVRRERYLKTSWGKRFIKNRLRTYLTG